MFFAGLDVGTRFVKAVVVDSEKQWLGEAMRPCGFDPVEASKQALAEALELSKLKERQIARIAATGDGREEVEAFRILTDVASVSTGMLALHPETRSILDIGSESGRAIRVNDEGRVIDFALNEKCAAGVGSFVESMARALDAGPSEFDAWSLKSENPVSMTAQCVVFAESEVISLLHQQVPREDIARAIFDAVAARSASLARRTGIAEPMALSGGLSQSRGFVASLKREIGIDDLTIPRRSPFIGAYGAAIAAIADEEA